MQPAALAPLAAALAGSLPAAAKCRTMLLAEQRSPDGAWRATVVQSTCEPEFGGASIIASVRLAPSQGDAPATDLLGVDTGGQAAEMPRLSWTGTRTLDVSVRSRKYLKVLHDRLGDVTLVIRDGGTPPADTGH